jgi:hypothetical protein
MLFIAMLVKHELQKGSLLYQRVTGSQSLPGLPGFTLPGFGWIASSCLIHACSDDCTR